jgi:uncharacterized membrane protein YqhA
MFTTAFAAVGWSFAVTLGDPANSNTTAMISEAVKLAIHALFLFMVSFPFQFDIPA